MATADRRTDTEDLTVERYDLELDDGEEQAVLADPDGERAVICRGGFGG